MTERKLICHVCGNEYTTTAQHSKYCSLECREIARRQHRKVWESNNIGYSREYAQMRRRAARRA